jgi:branched-chain amino acid transport system substrate-binding protein
MSFRSFAFAFGRRRAHSVKQLASPISPCRRAARLVATICAARPAFALAQLKTGRVLSLAGPAASLGIPARDTAAMLPKTMGGQKVEYIVLDDASDTTQAVQDTLKLISADHVDAITCRVHIDVSIYRVSDLLD